MKMRLLSLILVIAIGLAMAAGLCGCSSEGSDTQGSDTQTGAQGKSEKFGGMANVSSASTRESEEHRVLVSSDTYPCTITDYLGTEVTLDSKPQRVAVLSGSFINMWYALGGESICRTDLGSALIDPEHEAAIVALPSVGAVYNASVEAIIEQQPDFIITQAGVQAEISSTLRGMGFKIVTLLMKDYVDVVDHMRVFGVLLGSQVAAKERIAQMDAERKAITDRLPAEGKSAVILYLTSSSLSVKLDNSIAGDVANILGLRNIASDLPPDTLGSETTPLDIEYIVEKNPDVVLVTSMISSNEAAKETMEKEFATNPAWSGIEAIKEGRVIYLPQEYFLFNSAHNYVKAIEYMAKGVYPDIYGPLGQ